MFVVGDNDSGNVSFSHWKSATDEFCGGAALQIEKNLMFSTLLLNDDAHRARHTREGRKPD